MRRRRESGRIVDPATRKRRRRRVATIVLSIVLFAALASALGVYFYIRGIEARINPLTNLDPALAAIIKQDAPKAAGDPFYLLLMGTDKRTGETASRSDTLIVARIDPKNRKVQMMSIPRDTRVEIPGHGLTKINNAPFLGGPALAMKTVKAFTGLPISGYVMIDFKGFQRVVDAIGGVWFNVPEKIYNPEAPLWSRTHNVVQKGYQKLDGRKALIFVRSRHQFADGDFSRTRNQQAFVKALSKQALSLSNVFSAPAIIEAVADNMQTTLSLSQMVDLVGRFKGMKDGDMDSITIPGSAKYIDGVSYVIADEVKLHEVIGRMKRGLPLDPKKAPSAGTSTTTTVTVKPADVPLTVRNGAGVSGLAKQCTDFMISKGFKIGDTGNMNQFVYGRTLIVFQRGQEAKANFVREKLGFGDVVASAGMYSFKTPVMIVIGKDWKNPASSASR